MEPFQETVVLPPVLTTSVGSLPHRDADAALDLIMESLTTAPHPPQLTRVDPREQMWIQFTEGLPRFNVDLENLRYHFDTSGDPMPEAEEFFMQYIEVAEGASAEHFRVGEEYGKGIHLFLDRVRQSGKRFRFIKVHVTGPMSFGLTVPDQEGKPIFYDATFRDVAVKGMGLKAVWLVEQFKPYAQDVIVFFDEPSLSAYGSSAFLGVSQADVVESLDEVISMVSERGAIPGVHCCGNTDWGIVLQTSTRILNFDAVDYMHTLPIYAPDVSRFLDRGGALAWGAVPNDERIAQESADHVCARVKEGIEQLVDAGVDRDALTERIILTPSCGCSGATEEVAEKTYQVLARLDEMSGPDLFGNL